jgi:hypothetical protein
LVEVVHKSSLGEYYMILETEKKIAGVFLPFSGKLGTVFKVHIWKAERISQ